MPDAEEQLRAELNSLWYRWVRVRRQMGKGWGCLSFVHRAGAIVAIDSSTDDLPWDAIDLDVTHKSPGTFDALFLQRYRACVRATLLSGSPTKVEVTWDLIEERLGTGDGDMEFLHKQAATVSIEDLGSAVRRAGDQVLVWLRDQLALDQDTWMRDRATPAAH